MRRSNYGRQVWDPACDDIGWPRRDDGQWRWKFHDLRHVFATWALHDAGIPVEDLSRLMGHSSTRVTQASNEPRAVQSERTREARQRLVALEETR